MAERCPRCGRLIALVGRVHHCVEPKAAKPKFGDAVNVPLSEMAARGIENALVAKTDAERRLVVATGALKPLKITRPRAKKGTATYTGYRDADKRRASQRDLMRRRRTKGGVTSPGK